jgi:hypothetical protein
MVVFEPTAEEVHRKTGEWFEDEAIYEWFGKNLHLVTEPSMRQYLRAAELQRAGMDWMQIVPLAPEDQRQRLVAELQADTSFGTEESRVSEFMARGGGCRATYFNHARKLRGDALNGRKRPSTVGA